MEKRVIQQEETSKRQRTGDRGKPFPFETPAPDFAKGWRKENMSVPRGRARARSASMSGGGGGAAPFHRGGQYGYIKYRVPRSAQTRELYGVNLRYATPTQKQNRWQDSYSGPGRYHKRSYRGRRRHIRRGHYRYRGRGGFFGDLWSGVKKGLSVVAPIAEGFLPPAYGKLLHSANAAINPPTLHPSIDYDDYGPEGDYDGAGDYENMTMSGMGDYGPVTSNAIVTGVPQNSQSVPVHTAAVSNMTDSGDITISHKEFIQNISIIASTAGQVSSQFSIQTFQLNPGLQHVFPFLSQIAQNFTLYSMQGLMFSYKPTSGEMGINSQQLGKVIMATDYDPQAVPFINSIQMENYQFANSAKPSIGQVHGVECKRTESMLDMKYVRTGSTTRDLTLTDIGLFQLATEGVPFPTATQQGTTVVIGELWASYTIKLSRANLYGSLLGLNIQQWGRLMNMQSYVSSPSLATRPVATAGGQLPVPSSYFLIQDFKSNSMNLKVEIYQGISVTTERSLGQCIVITWPANTILGTFGYKIEYNSQNPPTSAQLGFLPSGRTAISANTFRLGNVANKITQWCCPFSHEVTQGAGKIKTPPAVNLDTGLPAMYGKDIDNANDALTLTNTYIAREQVSQATVDDTVHISQQYQNSPGQVPQQSYGNLCQGYVQINAPSLNVPVLVLEQCQAWSSLPVAATIDPIQYGSQFKVTVWACNNEIGIA
nr:putative capsid protein [Crucivirus sp.]